MRPDTCALLSAGKVAQERQGSPETPFWRLHWKNMLHSGHIGLSGTIVSGHAPCARVFTRPRPTTEIAKLQQQPMRTDHTPEPAVTFLDCTLHCNSLSQAQMKYFAEKQVGVQE